MGRSAGHQAWDQHEGIEQWEQTGMLWEVQEGGGRHGDGIGVTPHCLVAYLLNRHTLLSVWHQCWAFTVGLQHPGYWIVAHGDNFHGVTKLIPTD